MQHKRGTVINFSKALFAMPLGRERWVAVKVAAAAYALAAYVQANAASKARLLSAQTKRRPHSVCVAGGGI